MRNKDKDLIGKFEAIESFLITPDNQFGIIGDVLDGMVQVGAYVHIQLNNSLSLTAKINEVKDIQLSGETKKHKLLIFNNSDKDLNNFLYAMNVGSEIIAIRISGED